MNEEPSGRPAFLRWGSGRQRVALLVAVLTLVVVVVVVSGGDSSDAESESAERFAQAAERCAVLGARPLPALSGGRVYAEVDVAEREQMLAVAGPGLQVRAVIDANGPIASLISFALGDGPQAGEEFLAGIEETAVRAGDRARRIEFGSRGGLAYRQGGQSVISAPGACHGFTVAAPAGATVRDVLEEVLAGEVP